MFKNQLVNPKLILMMRMLKIFLEFNETLNSVRKDIMKGNQQAFYMGLEFKIKKAYSLNKDLSLLII